MQIDVSIPLTFTRTSIYVSILALVSLSVLLPWSVLSYAKFYQYLIPIPQVTVPLRFDYRLHRYGSFAIVNFGDVLELLRSEGGELEVGRLSYEVSVDFDGWCDANVQSVSDFGETAKENQPYRTVGMKMSIVRDSTLSNDLRPFEKDLSKQSLFKSKFSHVWPITHSGAPSEQFSSSTYRVSPGYSWHEQEQETSAVVWFPQQCASTEVASWIPPVVKPFVSPRVVGYLDENTYTTSHHSLVLFPDFKVGGEITNTMVDIASNYKLVVEFNTPTMMVFGEPRINFKVNWFGIRRFIFRHSWVSSVLGVSAFWAISTTTCTAVALSVWYWITSGVQPQVKPETHVKEEDTLQTLDYLLKQ